MLFNDDPIETFLIWPMVRESVFTADYNQFILIRRLRKHNLDFTDNQLWCWQNSRRGSPVGFGTIVHCYVQNDQNCTPRRPFINTEMVLYWNIASFTEYWYRTRNWKEFSIVVLQYRYYWGIAINPSQLNIVTKWGRSRKNIDQVSSILKVVWNQL